MTATTSRPTVAVIGSGVSGLTAAYLLRRTHDVRLFEADRRLGGHAHTHDVAGSDGIRRGIDSGFIVHNDRTYPHLRRLFTELAVQTRPTEMSMSICCEGCGLEFAGGRGLRGILAQPRRLADPAFVRLLRDVRRFHRAASIFLAGSEEDDLTSYGQFLRQRGFSTYFVNHYAIPVVACVWSTGVEDALRYPAQYLFQFLEHHGMLGLTGSPQWYTVTGGSRSYVDKIAALLPAAHAGRPVTDVIRHSDGVEVRDDAGAVSHVDRVVIATHPDQALALLSDPTDDEVQTLKAFGYTDNRAILHTDSTLLPGARRARACWNYAMSSCDSERDRPVVTYWMNRLQGLGAPEEYLVTLNADERVDPASVLAAMDYQHPVYTPEAVRAQRQLGGLATSRTVYAGAYHGWGFHEDGCRSGVAAAEHFGVDW